MFYSLEQRQRVEDRRERNVTNTCRASDIGHLSGQDFIQYEVSLSMHAPKADPSYLSRFQTTNNLAPQHSTVVSTALAVS